MIWCYLVCDIVPTLLSILVERVKGPFGEKRRSISGIVIDTDQFKQTKTLQEDELLHSRYRGTGAKSI
jgi:hypothetical protein